MMGSRLTLIATITVMLSWLGLTPAEAHVLAGQSHGVAAGLLHPFTGLDHLLAMLAIGIIASRLGGLAGRALPISCLLAMVTGASLGMQGVVMPYLEPAILVSVALLRAVSVRVVATQQCVGVSLRRPRGHLARQRTCP